MRSPERSHLIMKLKRMQLDISYHGLSVKLLLLKAVNSDTRMEQSDSLFKQTTKL